MKRLIALAARVLPDLCFSVLVLLLAVLVLEFIRVITS
jgi:hypothetical protein